MRFTKRCLIALLVALAAPLSGSAQEPSAPAETMIFTSSDLAGLLAGQPADRNSSKPMLRLAPYNVNVEHRVQSQGAAVHERDAELFYVLDGAGLLVTGGKLIGEKRSNAANLSGTGIEGGVSKRIAKGDFVLVPEGVPHQFPSVEGKLTLMSLHLPRKN